MKLILAIGALSLSVSASAVCPSVDSAVSRMKVGAATTTDLVSALACQLGEYSKEIGNPKALCKIRVAAFSAKYDYSVELFAVGQISRDELRWAKEELRYITAYCKTK